MRRFIIVVLCLMFTSHISSLSARVLDEDLVFYFDYEEFSGGKVIDKSGHGYDGTIKGDVTQANAGKFGKAGHFVSGSYLEIDGPNVDPDHIPTQGMSLIAWINVDAVTDMALFNARATDGTWVVHPEARGDGNFRWLNRGHNPGKTLFDIRAGKNTPNEWVHYAGTFSREEAMAYLYINGEKVGEEKARLPDPIASDWGQGARVGFNIDNKRPFAGLMDDMQVWKRGLTHDEVKSVMEDGISAITAVEAGGKLTTTWGNLKTN